MSHDACPPMITLALPAAMRDWIEAQVQTGRYRDGGAYLQDLIRRDQARAATLIEFQHLVAEDASGQDASGQDASGEAGSEAARQRVRDEPG